jgi:hypothetical protein
VSRNREWGHAMRLRLQIQGMAVGSSFVVDTRVRAQECYREARNVGCSVSTRKLDGAGWQVEKRVAFAGGRA